jgi:hypothetical protein
MKILFMILILLLLLPIITVLRNILQKVLLIHGDIVTLSNSSFDLLFTPWLGILTHCGAPSLLPRASSAQLVHDLDLGIGLASREHIDV